MQYFKKYNLAFFHIAKTGGTSFRDFLVRNLGKAKWYIKDTNHEPLTSKMSVMGKKLFDSINIVTIVRDPFTAVVSYYDSIYSHNCSLDGKLKPHVAEKYPALVDVYGLPFEEFIDWYVENEKSYADYLLVDNKIPGNVHIIKLESLKQDSNRVLNDILGLNLNVNKIGRLNSANRDKSAMDYYSNSSLNKIRNKYKWCIGYE